MTNAKRERAGHLRKDDKAGQNKQIVCATKFPQREFGRGADWAFPGKSSARSMTGARDAMVFPKSVMMNPNMANQQSYSYFAPIGWQPKKVDFPDGSAIFPLRGRSAIWENHWRLPFLAGTFLRPMARMSLAILSQRTAEEASKHFFASSS
jgi:hypothetical protein